MRRLHGFAIQRLLRDPSGNIVMLLAVMLSALFAFSALAVDGGNLYVLKSKLQRTADAAALAAAVSASSSICAAAYLPGCSFA